MFIEWRSTKSTILKDQDGEAVHTEVPFAVRGPFVDHTEHQVQPLALQICYLPLFHGHAIGWDKHLSQP